MGQWHWGAIVHGVLREVLADKVAFERKTKRRGGSESCQYLGDSSPSRGHCRYKGPGARHSWGGGGRARGLAWLEPQAQGEHEHRATGQGQTMWGLVAHWKDTGFILNETTPPWGSEQRSGLL